MEKFVKCEVDGEKYDRYISGSLKNREQTIECEKIEECSNVDDAVIAYPKKNESIHWYEQDGTAHCTYLFKGKGFVVPKKFVFE